MIHLNKTPFPSVDTVYWIFSTMPQVLGALVGLMLTVILFYYSSLDKRAENSQELLDIIEAVKKPLYRFGILLLISTSIAIAIDIVIMRYAAWGVMIMTSEKVLMQFIPEYYIIWGLILINFVPIIILLYLLNQLLHPTFERDTIQKATDKLVKRLAKKHIEELDEKDKIADANGDKKTPGEKENTSDKSTNRRFVFTKSQFLKIYSDFEYLARKWARANGLGVNLHIRDIIDNLKTSGIINTSICHHLFEATRIRNYAAHGASIPMVSGIVMRDLVNATEKLTSILGFNNQNEGMESDD